VCVSGLPDHLSEFQRLKIVEETLSLLDLSEVRFTLVGITTNKQLFNNMILNQTRFRKVMQPNEDYRVVKNVDCRLASSCVRRRWFCCSMNRRLDWTAVPPVHWSTLYNNLLEL
jgi:hypothetical protein